ncbi:MAG: hypothetical protein ACYCTI_04245 [Acidimicrobiales bacterium]
MAMAVIVVLGVTLVAYSRQERLHPASAAVDTTPPTLSADWTEGVAFDICGTIAPSLPASPSSTAIGIKTSGNGVINLQPLTKADTGHNATLGRFASHYPGLTLTADSIKLPGGKLYTNGQSCGSKPGYLQVKTWSNPTSQSGKIYSGDPTKLLLENGQLITVAFVPRGTSIPKPPGTVVTGVLTGMTAAATKGSTTATTSATNSLTPLTTPLTTPAPSTAPTPSTAPATTPTTIGKTTTSSP